jgi:hypothetical protein
MMAVARTRLQQNLRSAEHLLGGKKQAGSSRFKKPIAARNGLNSPGVRIHPWLIKTQQL